MTSVPLYLPFNYVWIPTACSTTKAASTTQRKQWIGLTKRGGDGQFSSWGSNTFCGAWNFCVMSVKTSLHKALGLENKIYIYTCLFILFCYICFVIKEETTQIFMFSRKELRGAELDIVLYILTSLICIQYLSTSGAWWELLDVLWILKQLQMYT